LTTERSDPQPLIERCLAAFIAAGTLDLSMDRLAVAVKVSKRMLIHYFGNREKLELAALALLEERLRAQFAAGSLPRRMSPRQVIRRLWEQTTAPESHGALLLIMDIARRASAGSQRARQFYAQQLQLWRDLLSQYLPSRAAVDAVLQAFQGAVFEYLVTGNEALARATLLRATARQGSAGD
jgi:AcrR family transcriptional regulator